MKIVHTISLLYTIFLLGKTAPVVESIDQEVLGEVTESDLLPTKSQGGLEVIELVNSDPLELEVASREVTNPFFWDPWAGSEKIARELLRNGAEVNAGDYHGRTALHQAVIGQRKNVVVELLKNGADITAKDNDGRTAVHLAAGIKGLEILKVLLEKGGDVNVRDNDGKTPLQLAATDGIEWRFLR